MAKSLDALIEFLLEEIALGGEGGLSFSDIAAHVDRFYASHEKDATNAPEESLVRALLDWRFFEKLWLWLGRLPDVSIGKNHQYDGVPLAVVEHKYPGFASWNVSRTKSDPSSEIAAAEDAVDSPRPTLHSSQGPKVYTTEARMFAAICGHPPDPSRVAASEWALLSCIAASRHKGVLQGDLGRLTGQDKRSVPKRTDALREKGYIEKREAYLRGTKTSRLILRRFTEPQTATADGSLPFSDLEKLSIRYQARQMFDEIQGRPLTSEDDLCDALNLSTIAQRKIFSKIARHFGKRGCLKRVKSASFSGDVKWHIKWLRGANDDDWQADDVDEIDFTKSLDELTETYEENEGVKTARVVLPSLPDHEQHLDAADPQLPLAQWNPDRVFTNVLYQAVWLAATHGLTNLAARNLTTGPFVRRVVESLLAKLTFDPLHSQSPDSTNLVILRAMETVDGISQFVYYTFDNFSSLVQEGRATWANVDGCRDSGDAFKLMCSGTTNLTNDQFGFALNGLQQPHFTYSGDEIWVAPDSSEMIVGNLRPGDPLLGRDDDDKYFLTSYEASQRRPKAQGSLVKLTHAKMHGIPVKRGRPPKKTSPAKQIDETSHGAHPRSLQSTVDNGKAVKGRPRKFLRGTEKFWRDMFLIAKQQEDPTYSENKSSKAGLMKDPAGMSVFEARPEQFDEMLLAAEREHLPWPREPQDVSQDWVDRTKSILDRQANGLYLSMVGSYRATKGPKAMIMIFRSPRLREVTFNEQSKSWKWQFLTSSAAHSQRSVPFYPRSEHWLKPSFIGRRDTTPAWRQAQNLEGPPKGIFLENPEREEQCTSGSRPRKESQTYYESLPLDGDSDSTDTDSAVALTSPQRGRIPELSKGEATTEDTCQAPQVEGLSQKHDYYSNFANQDLSIIKERLSMTRGHIRRAAEHPQRVADKDIASPTGSITQLTTANNSDATPLVVSYEQADDKVDRVMENALESLPMASLASPEFRQSGLPRALLTQLKSIAQTASMTLPALVGSRNLALSRPEGLIVRKARKTFLRPHISSERFSTLSLLNNGDVQMQQPQLGNECSGDLRTSTPEGPPMLDVIQQDPTMSLAVESVLGDSVSQLDDEHVVESQPKSTPLRELGKTAVGKLCRHILLELIELCSGLAPYDPSAFRRAMSARWQESDIDAALPSSRLVRNSLKALCAGKKVKQMIFPVLDANGSSVMRSIVALREIDGLSPEFRLLQQKMREHGAQDYIPPILRAEAERMPSNLRMRRGLVTATDTQSDLESDILMPKTGSSSRHKRSHEKPPRVPTNPSAHGAFITLRTAQLHILQLPTDHRVPYTLPSDAQQIPSIPSGSKTQTAETLSSRESHRQSGQKIIWARDPARLPRSLAQVPGVKIAREEAILNDCSDPDTARFFAEIDRVEVWEHQSEALFSQTTEKAIFINHQWPIPKVRSSGITTKSCEIQFHTLIEYNDEGTAVEAEFPEVVSWPPFRALKRKPKSSKKRARFIEARTDDDGEVDPSESAELHRPRRKAALKRKQVFDESEIDRATSQKRRRYRREVTDKAAQTLGAHDQLPQPLRQLAPERRKSLVLAVVIVRILNGGIEKLIDWRLVNKLVQGVGPQTLQVAWRTLSSHHATEIEALEEALQEKYLEDLQQGKVPSMNFSNPADTDWRGIFEWASNCLQTFTVRDAQYLPASRSAFLRTNECLVDPMSGIRDIVAYGNNASMFRKEQALGSVIFGTRPDAATASDFVEVNPLVDVEQEAEDVMLSRAKSWIIATLVTPEKSYDAVKTRAKLLTLAADSDQCEAIIERAMTSLQRDKFIIPTKVDSNPLSTTGNSSSSSGNGGMAEVADTTGVRIWELSPKYYENFDYRRQITAPMLRKAASYKLDVLDRAFSRSETVTLFSSDNDNDGDLSPCDGDMVAILNLKSMGQVMIKPGSDLPDTRYGLDHESIGYETRRMSKKSYSFSVVLAPTAEYVFGDILRDGRDTVPVPRGGIVDTTAQSGIGIGIGDDSGGKIPPWFDVNHDFRPEMWEMMLGAVVGLTSHRPGIDAVEISRTFNSAIDVADVTMLLEYAAGVGAVVVAGANYGGGGGGGGGGDDDDDVGGNEDRRGTENGKGKGRRKGWETTEWWWMCIGIGL